MRMERINENQVRFMIDSQDLAERNLSLSNLKYGSEGTRKLFQDMLHQASEKFDFNNEELPLMVEAIPMNPNELMVIISVVEDADELDPHFARFTSAPGQESGDSAKDQGVFFEPGEAQGAPNVCLIRLNTFRDVTVFCKHFFLSFSAPHYLYKKDNVFYIAFEKPAKMTDQAFLQFLNSIREFGELVPQSPALYAYLKEHDKPVMDQPLIRLGALDI